MNVKIILYEGIVVLTVLDSVDTWSIGVVDKRLIVMEMRYLRNMYGTIWMDRVRNEEVRRMSVGKMSRAMYAEMVWVC